jgi:hypothetical protein
MTRLRRHRPELKANAVSRHCRGHIPALSRAPNRCGRGARTDTSALQPTAQMVTASGTVLPRSQYRRGRHPQPAAIPHTIQQRLSPGQLTHGRYLRTVQSERNRYAYMFSRGSIRCNCTNIRRYTGDLVKRRICRAAFGGHGVGSPKSSSPSPAPRRKANRCRSAQKASVL